MVKAYARSAAGMDIELVSEIRSPDACLVIEHLAETKVSLLISNRKPSSTS